MDSETEKDGDDMAEITLTKAAQLAGVTRETLRRHANSGKLQVKKRGTRNYTTRAWLRAWQNDPALHLPGNPKLRKSHD